MRMRASLHSGRARACHRRQTACRAVKQIAGVSEDLRQAIEQAVPNCLTETYSEQARRHVKPPVVGKVRDMYDMGDRLLIVTTDRQSAFDRLLAAIPFKGQVLNQVSAWWFEQTAHIVPNSLLSVPDPCASVMQKCAVFPVEFVVRGYMTGSTETSLWTHYRNGEREYCGNALPDGMAKNERLAANIITPTTKSAERDVPISPADIVSQGLMSQEHWDAASAAAMRLFEFGQATAAQRGLLLVDTKYEMGLDSDGNVLLVDEVHTPDSSRYWIADSYEARLAAGEEPENIDKEFLRLWFRDNCDPYNDEALPAAPRDLVVELSARYIYLYETITGKTFEVQDASEPAAQRMARNLGWDD